MESLQVSWHFAPPGETIYVERGSEAGRAAERVELISAAIDNAPRSLPSCTQSFLYPHKAEALSPDGNHRQACRLKEAARGVAQSRPVHAGHSLLPWKGRDAGIRHVDWKGWWGVGTSSTWPGPSGRTGMAGEWSRVSKRISSWRPAPDAPDGARNLDDIAADHLDVLHRTLRDDRNAFGLFEAVCAGAERLTVTLENWTPVRNSDSAVARFVTAVGGTGGTMADVAVRRAAASTAARLNRFLQKHPNALASGGGLTGELFCLIYQWFFGDTVAEFLRLAVAEKVKLAVPLLNGLDPEDHIADWIAERVLDLLPNPCEEAAHLAGEVEQAEQAAMAATDPLGALRLVAGELVPRAAGRALGLITGGQDEEGEAEACTSDEEVSTA